MIRYIFESTILFKPQRGTKPSTPAQWYPLPFPGKAALVQLAPAGRVSLAGWWLSCLLSLPAAGSSSQSSRLFCFQGLTWKYRAVFLFFFFRLPSDACGPQAATAVLGCGCSSWLCAALAGGRRAFLRNFCQWLWFF